MFTVTFLLQGAAWVYLLLGAAGQTGSLDDRVSASSSIDVSVHNVHSDLSVTGCRLGLPVIGRRRSNGQLGEQGLS
jgi:hypothetical protein